MCPLCPSDISPAERGKPGPLAAPFTLPLRPPLNLPLGGGGKVARERGYHRLPVLLWIPACAGMTGVLAGMAGLLGSDV